MSGNAINVSTAGAVSFNGSIFTSGVLPIAYGGTNTNSFTVTNGVVSYDGSKMVTVTGPQISSAGIYTNSVQPGFLAKITISQDNISGDGTIAQVLFDSKLFDVGNNFDTGNSKFTAPVTGYYSFNAQVTRININTSTTNTLFLNFTRPGLTNIAYSCQRSMIDSTDTLSVSALVYLELGDTAEVLYQASGGAKDIDLLGGTTTLFTNISGYLIC